MAINDSFVASFLNKYHYNFWRPETAIRAGDTDGNSENRSRSHFLPFIATPCFPSYPSNHASGSNSGAEVMRRLYGEGGHSITLSRILPCPTSFCSTPRSSRLPMMSTTRAFTAEYIFDSTKLEVRDWAYSPAQARTRNLVGSKMYSAVNARVGDVVGNLLKRGVLQDDVGHRRIRQRDRMSSLAVQPSQNLGSSTTCTAVVGGITRETWGRDKGDKAGIRIGFRSCRLCRQHGLLFRVAKNCSDTC